MPVLGQELFSKGFNLTVGGSAIVANGLHRLGSLVGLVANIGDDPVSKLVWEILGDAEIDRSLIQKQNRPLMKLTVALSYPEDRAFISYVDQDTAFPDLISILEDNSARHLHICSLLAVMDHPEIIQQAHAAGLTVSMDPGWEESALVDQKFLNCLETLDIFFPSESEICKISGNSVPEQAAVDIFSKMQGGILVVKQGAKGAVAYSKEAPQGLHHPAMHVDVVDTTGAGDSFDAGFLFAHLNHQPLATCMKIGTICGSLSTTRAGGIAGFPTWEELEKWL